MLLVIAVMLTPLITPSINNTTFGGQIAYNIYTADNSFSIERRIVLNNSYYIKTFQLFKTGDPRYYNSLIYGYDIVNIDGDNYPDIVLWRLKNISVWSCGRGIYASISTGYMYDKPIIIDQNGDGIVDYILLIEHNSYDAGTYYAQHVDRIWTKIYKWYPTTSIVEEIADINVYASSKTHVIIGELLILPTIINIYTYPYYGYFIINRNSPSRPG